MTRSLYESREKHGHFRVVSPQVGFNGELLRQLVLQYNIF
jgi:hypothetical protein